MIVSELIGTHTIPAPVVISANERVIVVGTLLAYKNVSSIVLRNDDKIIGLFGYQLVSFVINTPKDKLYKSLWTSIRTLQQKLPVSRVPIFESNVKLEAILKAIASNRFGDVIIKNGNGRLLAILSLNQIMECLVSKFDSLGLKVREVGSPLKLVDEDQSLSETVRHMMRHRIRRAIIRREGKHYAVTEREILRLLFSLNGLQSLRDDPESFLERPFGELLQSELRELPEVKGGIDVAEAWKYTKGDPSLCLIVDNELVATPWDLVIKPYLEGRLLLP